ncbi:MAG: restriction endonuclease, partial [Betaproteobacteria bacterium]|nr:restriction endonuclease [Betaproteobacteria bacterium]
MLPHEPDFTAPDEGLRALYPLILTLDMHGVPHRWITWQHACYYYAKNQVAWTLGERAFTVYGGLN